MLAERIFESGSEKVYNYINRQEAQIVEQIAKYKNGDISYFDLQIYINQKMLEIQRMIDDSLEEELTNYYKKVSAPKDFKGFAQSILLTSIAAGTFKKSFKNQIDLSEKTILKWAKQNEMSLIIKYGLAFATPEDKRNLAKNIRAGYRKKALDFALDTIDKAGDTLDYQFAVISTRPKPCKYCDPWDGILLSINGMEGYPSISDVRSSGWGHYGDRCSIELVPENKIEEIGKSNLLNQSRKNKIEMNKISIQKRDELVKKYKNVIEDIEKKTKEQIAKEVVQKGF